MRRPPLLRRDYDIVINARSGRAVGELTTRRKVIHQRVITAANLSNLHSNVCEKCIQIVFMGAAVHSVCSRAKSKDSSCFQVGIP